jgi:hypothetical protein
MRFQETHWPARFVCLLLVLPAGCTVDNPYLREPYSPSPPVPAVHGDQPARTIDKPDASPVQMEPLPEPPVQAPLPHPVNAWGIAGIRGFPFGQQVAPNGLEFNQLFTLDMDFSLMLWSDEKLYMFTETRFWGQKPGAGVTNANQGIFDFSKREFDLDLGAAWNYSGSLEARVFAYSLNNLNRGKSLGSPSGFNDGIGLENRYYFDPTYADLGTEAFDQARATFLSLGGYPTKDLVDGDGLVFKPGLFARAYLTYDLWQERCCYLYLDTQLITRRTLQAKLLLFDGGVAIRPFLAHPRFEFRVGSENNYDLQWGELETSLYGAIRYVF